MTNPNEFRIGNLVSDGHVCNYKVNAHWFDNTNFEMATPIPISPEILEKCGFEEQAYISFKTHEKKYTGKFEIPVTEYMSLGFENGNVYLKMDVEDGVENLPNIKYLHQLQNLFYCLCGEELKINL